MAITSEKKTFQLWEPTKQRTKTHHTSIALTK